MATPADQPPTATAEESESIGGDLVEIIAPEPIQIVDFNVETGKLVLNEDAVKQVLLRDDVKRKPVSVVSVAGPFRKGKSFLLNFCLRYMHHEGSSDWLGDLSEPLQGFKWRSGSQRETTGIWMWSEPFLRTLPSGEEVAVILLDTQGTFDNKTTMRQNATIFALNALLSSYQIYNVPEMIRENVLQHMHLFTDFGNLVQKTEKDGDEDLKPFQTLHFLVRDWYHYEEHAYGSEGGKGYLSEVFAEDSEDMDEELRSVRKHLRGCYSEIACTLMPHPGRAVAGSKNFTGALKDVDEEFRTQLQSFIPSVLDNKDIVKKQVLGDDVNGEGLFEYIKNYVDIFACGDLPTVSTVFDATAAVNHMNIMNKARQFYEENMTQVCGPDRPYIQSKVLEQAHQSAKESAFTMYRSTKKLTNAALEKEYEDRLEKEIEELFAKYEEWNDKKQILRKFLTPLTFAILAFVANILTTILSAIGLSPIAVLLNYVTWISFFAIGLWVYCDYSGEFPDVRTEMDGFALWMFEMVQTHLLQGAVAAADMANKKGK